MFGKRKPPGSGGPTQDGPNQGNGEPQMPAEGESRTPASTPLTRGRPSYEVARRSFEAAAAVRRGEPRAEQRGETEAGGAGRKLVVGHGIRLAGEIKKCETLVVEGHIEADLNDCASLEINETGEYLGSAVVDEAEISGHFDGSLTVRGRLLLRASGVVRGTIRYADLEIERGGRIAGDVDVLAPDAMSARDELPHEAAIEQGEAEGEPDVAEAEAHPVTATGGGTSGALL